MFVSFDEVFNKKKVTLTLEQLERRMIENRDCAVCKHCIDISDDRNTCLMCEYGGFADETCLMWERE